MEKPARRLPRVWKRRPVNVRRLRDNCRRVNVQYAMKIANAIVSIFRRASWFRRRRVWFPYRLTFVDYIPTALLIPRRFSTARTRARAHTHNDVSNNNVRVVKQTEWNSIHSKPTRLSSLGRLYHIYIYSCENQTALVVGNSS